MIITSYIDKEYYVLNNKNYHIFLLATLLCDKDKYELGNLLLENRLDLLAKPLFINKETPLGKEISLLIKENKVKDESFNLKEETIFKALKFILQTETLISLEEQSYYISIIINLIKKNDNGLVNNLKDKYNEEALNTIIKMGNMAQHLEKTKELTGFEYEGLIFEDEKLFEINLTTKEQKELSEKNKEKKLQKRIDNY